MAKKKDLYKYTKKLSDYAAKIPVYNSTTYIYRSAKTGRIVTEKWALKHPATTTKEKVKR